MSHKLPNYLKTYRKRAGLTQDEMAFLLGCKSGAKVSRYEQFKRRPSLETVFAYQTILQVPANELFAGIFQEAQRETNKRVESLKKKLSQAEPTPLVARKLEMLNAFSPEPAQVVQKIS
jgi:transcriptional regulator with XRE-family HTH domain